ncbi:myb dna-binding domain containing protein [Ophiostoma piceae UAMH 11346]|uniref:Myb dna-binding domain containing protein n=1 Tax=Ophiostoma piceae (strain UAMH 11346) TaxID=1262450 RepID=S3CFM1_OPHP1|nr:myb dna-binding domain containing protein [Ophiostoma piceae UAMH 11346]
MSRARHGALIWTSTELPSPAALLLEAWTNNEETKKLIDGLLRPPSLTSIDSLGGPAMPIASGGAHGDTEDKGHANGVESEDHVYKHRLAAFDSELSVLSTVVTAIKALKTNSSQLSVLARSPGSSAQDMDMMKRSDIPVVREHLLQAIFPQNENEVLWTDLQLVNGIDTINSLEGRRRRDLDAIAAKLGICNDLQLEVARHRMDPGLDIIEPLIAQNDEAQALFRTVYLGTRICAICHHISGKAKAEFMLQLLNSLFPPYLMSYPSSGIHVGEIRALREKAYMIIIGPSKIFDGLSGEGSSTSLGTDAIQKDLLSHVSIQGSWSAEIWPALNAYFDQIMSVHEACDQLDIGQKHTSGSSRHNSYDSQAPASGSSRTPSIKPILKNSVSSMSSQSVSTYGSSCGSSSDLVMHPLAKEMSGLDDQELQRMGLAIYPGTRSHQASFDSKGTSPMTQARLRSQLYFGEDFQMTPSSRGSCPLISTNSASSYNQMVVSTSSEDDVFSTPTEQGPKEDELVSGLDMAPDPVEQDLERGSPGHQSLPFPDLKPMKSTATLKSTSTKLQALSTSERTLRHIKSRLKSTESLFSRFIAMEPSSSQVPVLPTNSSQAGGTRPPSSRRPSKVVRFSEEENSHDGRPSLDLPERLAGNPTTHHATSQEKAEPFVPPDPWQYTRFYLLEKVKAEQEGRECALPSPPPEWFVGPERTANRPPILLTQNSRDAFSKFVANAAAPRAPGASTYMRTVSSDSTASTKTTIRTPLTFADGSDNSSAQSMSTARSKEKYDMFGQSARPLTFFRKKSISSKDDNRPASSAATRSTHFNAGGQPNDNDFQEEDEDEHYAPMGQNASFFTPRLGKLAFEMAMSESRKNLDLDVKLFQRQSLLLAAKKQIEGDNLKRLKLMYDGSELTKLNDAKVKEQKEEEGALPVKVDITSLEAGAPTNGDMPPPSRPHPGDLVAINSTQTSIASRASSFSASSSFNKSGGVDGSFGTGSSGPADPNQSRFPSPRRPSRRRHLRSITQPFNTLKDSNSDRNRYGSSANAASSSFSFRMGLRSREVSSASQKTPFSRPSTAAGSLSSSANQALGLGTGSSDTGSNTKENDNKGACATMDDFSLPQVPPDLEGYFTLMPEESKELREKRNRWFREQVDKEDQHGQAKVSDDHHHHQPFLKKKRKQPPQSSSQDPKEIVLPDTMLPPPSSVSKAWTSLKRGASRMLVPRKSTMDLRDLAKKRAASAPMPSTVSSSCNSSEGTSGDSSRKASEGTIGPGHLENDAMCNDNKSRGHGDEVREDGGLSIQLRKRQPSRAATAVHPPTNPGDIPLPLSPIMVQNEAFRAFPAPLRFLGPTSPPPTSPLPPIPPTTGVRPRMDNPMGGMTDKSSNSGDSSLPESETDIRGLDTFDQYLEDEANTTCVLGKNSKRSDGGDHEDIPSSPASNVAGDNTRARSSSVCVLEDVPTCHASSVEDFPSSDEGKGTGTD